MQSKSCYYYAIILCALLSTIQNHAEIQQLLLIPTTGGPTTISDPGHYVLGNDITGSIIIASSQVVLDLNGHTITGGNISIPTTLPRSDIIIHNGTLRDTTAGTNAIEILGPAGLHKNITVSNIAIDTPATVGILVDLCNNLLISNVLVFATTAVATGIQLTNVMFATIEDVRINTCTTGIDVANTCAKILIRNSIASACMDEGFNVSGVSVEVIGCIANVNGTGFITGSPITATFINCIAQGNTADGMLIGGTPGGSVQVLNCQALNNVGNGFTFSAMTASTIVMKDCLAAYNSGNGFNIPLTVNGSIERCSAIGNTLNGFIDLEGAASTMRYVSNFAVDNGVLNIDPTLGVPFESTSATAATSYWRNVSSAGL